MEKLVVAHQAEFLPYIGFFQRLLKANLLIIADSVQYEKQNFQNRNRIKTVRGAKWMTASIIKHPVETSINQIFLSNTIDWRTEHLCLIRENYKDAPFYNQIYPIIVELYDYKCEKLVDFNINSIRKLCELLEINIDIILSSSLDVHGKKDDLIIDMLQKVGATAYISGDGAKKYSNPKSFEAAGINVIWQNFKHPVYPQVNGDFLPYMSSIDLLFNCGIQESQKIIRDI
ncbi:MAG: WbqC-like family protein [Clostridia bacterium]|jgi:hypothetical protein|nr:WbqC-like family protein [Clostridia bacterium]